MTTKATPTVVDIEKYRRVFEENPFEHLEKQVTRDPRSGRIVGEGSVYGDDSGVEVRFSTERVFDKLATYLANEEGDMTNKYADQEWIYIHNPGNKLLSIHTPVEEFHKWRFPTEYAAFKAGKEYEANGTPLSQWSFLKQNEVEEFKRQGITTVEQIANMSDQNKGIMNGFHGIKAKARLFLDMTKNTELQDLVAAARNENKTELDAMKAQLAELKALLTAKGRAADK